MNTSRIVFRMASPCNWSRRWFGIRESFLLDEHENNDGTECVLLLYEAQLTEIDAVVKYYQGRQFLAFF